MRERVNEIRGLDWVGKSRECRLQVWVLSRGFGQAEGQAGDLGTRRRWVGCSSSQGLAKKLSRSREES